MYFFQTEQLALVSYSHTKCPVTYLSVKAMNVKFLFSALLLLISVNATARHAAIVIDADDGTVLLEQDATQAWYPASLTKVMTLYLAFHALRSGQLQINEPLTVSSHAASQPKSHLGLRFGEHLSTEDAILATIMRSANDAAVVLAERIGGSEENFARMMTAKAKTIGMSSSNFVNATGLPHDLQITTPRDMALLAMHLQRDFPEYYQYFGNHSFNYKGQTLKGINAFTAKYPGAEGLKTGFTCGSGYNLLAAAKQNGRRLIGVVLGGMSSQQRYQLMYNIMDEGFSNQNSGNSNRNIFAMPTSYAGTPPYQLGCGEHANLASASFNSGVAAHAPSKHAMLKHHSLPVQTASHSAGKKQFRTTLAGNANKVKAVQTAKKSPSPKAKTATVTVAAKKQVSGPNSHKPKTEKTLAKNHNANPKVVVAVKRTVTTDTALQNKATAKKHAILASR